MASTDSGSTSAATGGDARTSRRSSVSHQAPNGGSRRPTPPSIQTTNQVGFAMPVKVVKVLLTAVVLHFLLHANMERLPEPIRQNVQSFYAALNTTMQQIRASLTRVFASAADKITGSGEGESAEFEQIPELSNDEDLDEALKKHDRIYLMAYAPWCGHCKNMKPALVELVKQINETFEENKIRVYRYNVVKECENCKIQSLTSQIKGFPTLMLVYQGKLPEMYDGARTKDAMAAFIDESFLPLEATNDSEAIEKHLKSNALGMINYFPAAKMHIDDAAKATFGASKSTVLFVTQPELVKSVIGQKNLGEFDASVPQILVFKYQTYKGKFPQNVTTPVNPSIMAYMIANESTGNFSDKQFMGGKLPPIFVIARIAGKRTQDYLSSGAAKALKSAVNDPSLIGQSVLLHLNPQSDDDKKIAAIVGLNKGDIDCLVIFDTQKNKRHGLCASRYHLDDDYKVKDLVEFIHNAIQGNIPETVNANLKQFDDSHPIAALGKHDAQGYVDQHANVLIYTYIVSKHGMDDSVKFAALCYQNMKLAEFELSIDSESTIGSRSITQENAPEVILFKNGAYVDEYKGEISSEAIDEFVKKHGFELCPSSHADADL